MASQDPQLSDAPIPTVIASSKAYNSHYFHHKHQNMHCRGHPPISNIFVKSASLFFPSCHQYFHFRSRLSPISFQPQRPASLNALTFRRISQLFTFISNSQKLNLSFLKCANRDSCFWPYFRISIFQQIFRFPSTVRDFRTDCARFIFSLYSVDVSANTHGFCI